MSAPIVRPARSTDAGRVGAILSAFIDDTPWMPRVHTRAEDLGFAGMMIDRDWVSVVETSGQVMGFAARQAHLVQALYIDAAYQGQGLGSLLLKGLQAQSDLLSLWTFQANLPAQKFYDKHGFSEFERTDGAGNDESLPDIRLEWRRG